MTDQLVTKETAILAKEKGFDGKCIAGYDAGITNPLWLHTDGKFESLCYRDKSTVNADCVLVPTQELLHKWLREEFGVYVSMTPHKTQKDEVMWFSQVFTLQRYNMTYKSFEYITMFGKGDTYEEALEEGLVAALKKIKI